MHAARAPYLDALVRVDPGTGRFSVARSSYTDPAILAAEMEKIFSKCWLYVGHDSELAKPDQFITRQVAGRGVIFLRDRDGNIRCFLNICPHRGAQICRHREGKARNFSCLYHGWTFENTGRAVSIAEPETYPKDFNTGGRNDMVPVPRFENYRGLWFLNFDRNAISLSEYLGKACDYIDVIVDQAEKGMQIISGVQEYSARANWKLLAENSTDILHVEALHPTYLDLVTTNSGGKMRRGKMEGKALDLGNGHSVVERRATYGRPIAQWISLWGEEAKAEIDAIYDRLTARFGPERAHRMAKCSRNLLIFPNLVLNDIMSITVRVFQPTAADFMDVSVWSLAPVEEIGKPALSRRLSNFLEFLGPGGFATPDDIEALESCQRAAAAAAEAPWNDLSKGFDAAGADAIGDTKDELPQRAFWRGWQARLLQEEKSGYGQARRADANGHRRFSDQRGGAP
ncbi:MAG: aromatic ring-hydroxylating oxygenase subunit alpha [Xanthobacteraceae bacterium]